MCIIHAFIRYGPALHVAMLGVATVTLQFSVYYATPHTQPGAQVSELENCEVDTCML
jgi:hypothetical protein